FCYDPQFSNILPSFYHDEQQNRKEGFDKAKSLGRGRGGFGGGEGTFLRKGSLPPPKPSPLPPKTFGVIESLFEILLIIVGKRG
ncbi:hypothetical protein, partial [Bilophila wadsworthia]|uniref:hypothetical protein n=1 Tax=Bilophila wadsworthia TaxID=35833 RepID=UPI00266BF73E